MIYRILTHSMLKVEYFNENENQVGSRVIHKL